MPTSVRYALQFSAILVAALSSGISAGAQASKTSLTITSEQQVQIRELTSRILQHADSAGCKKNSCAILVANFAGPTGSTSALGIQLSDAVSAGFAAQAKGVQIVDRQKLQQYLEKERIASKLLEDDNAARWLAKENGATAVLVGYLRGNQQQKVLRVQLLDTRDFGEKNATPRGPVAEATINDLGYPGDLDPAEPFGPPPKTEFVGEALETGAVPPNCPNHRDPNYTEAARQARFSGGVVLQAVFLKDGSVTYVHAIQGAPFGLNQSAEQVTHKWKCEPATKDGRPVTVSVPVEFTFRVY
jgi:TonB family protein